MKWFQIIIPAGKYKSLITHSHVNLYVKEYIENIHLAYNISDLVISRAGALSLTEISYMKKPSIVIPSPNVANDHQLKNALSFHKKQAIILLEEKNINELNEVLINTLFDEDLLKQLRDNISLFYQYNSAEKIYDHIINELWLIIIYVFYSQEPMLLWMKNSFLFCLINKL